MTAMLPAAAPADAAQSSPAAPTTRHGRWLGSAGRPSWERRALAALLAGTAVLYLWSLGSSGNANSFYAAAVQAGTQSWKAWLFGSLDSANFITVDKPPASLWVMVASARIFGFNSWSMLVPQALMGVAAVALLYAAVRRWYGPAAGLAAGALLALTPVAVLMFRYNNPDALLTLLLVAAAYFVVRAIDDAGRRAGTWWLVAAGGALGVGFLTKMLQAFLVLPGLALVYLIVAPTGLRRRILQLLVAGAAVVVSAGWYIALVELWPAGSRPYIGGSTNNSLLELALGYNGLSRISGGGLGGGDGGGGGFGGTAGITRLFNSQFGGQISWLLPAALLALVAGLWATRRAPRTDRTRAGLLLWGGWLLVTAGVFSYMTGIIHPYYTVALAPAIAGLVAIGGRLAWQGRQSVLVRLVTAVGVAGTAAWSFALLSGTPDWLPWLRWTVLAAGLLAAAALVVPPTRWARVGVVVVLASILAGAGGATAYAVQTAGSAYTGPIVAAGPASAGGFGGGPGGVGVGPGGVGVGPGGVGVGPGGVGGAPRDGGQLPGGQLPGGQLPGGQLPGGQLPAGGAGPGGQGGQASSELTEKLRSAGTTWSAATTGSQSAADLELSSGTAVMAIGGWNGSDPAPSLAEFQALVADGRIHYFVAGGGAGGAGGPGGRGSSSDIATWVRAHYAVVTVGSQTVYDLTQPTG